MWAPMRVCFNRATHRELIKFMIGVSLGFMLHMSMSPFPDDAPNQQKSACLCEKQNIEKEETPPPPLHPPFKPQDMFQVLRYDYLDKRHVYNVLDDDPRINIFGARKEHLTDITQQASTLLNKKLGTGGDLYITNIFNMYYRVDPLRGEETIMHVETFNKDIGGDQQKRKYHLELVKPYHPAQLVDLTEIKDDTIVHFILPLLGAGERFHRFMDQFEKICLKPQQQIHLIIILFEGNAGDRDKYKQDEVITKINELTSKYKNSHLEIIKKPGDFNRGLGIDAGAQTLTDGDLMFFCDVDVFFDAGFLTRCRENTVQGKQVYYPGVFAQYNPEIIEKYSPSKWPLNDIHKYIGHWVHYGFGMVCLYKQDYTAVGGFDLDIKGWGGEDVNLYTKHLKSNLKVFRAMDPALFHHYHHKSCDPNLTKEQMRMCVGAMAAGYGSRHQLAMKVLMHDGN